MRIVALLSGGKDSVHAALYAVYVLGHELVACANLYPCATRGDGQGDENSDENNDDTADEKLADNDSNNKNGSGHSSSSASSSPSATLLTKCGDNSSSGARCTEPSGRTSETRGVAAGNTGAASELTDNAEYVGERDSYMFQTVGARLVGDAYAQCLSFTIGGGGGGGDNDAHCVPRMFRRGTRCRSSRTSRELAYYTPRRGDEVEDLHALLCQVKRSLAGGVDGVVSGAILSDYQRYRVESAASRCGLTSIAPLWRRCAQRDLLNEMLATRIRAVMVKVASAGLTRTQHLGREIDAAMLRELCQLEERYGVHVCGEGGEYETLVVDCPLFRKRIVIEDAQMIDADAGGGSDDPLRGATSYMNVKRFRLERKTRAEIDAEWRDVAHALAAQRTPPWPFVAASRPPLDDVPFRPTRRDADTQCAQASPTVRVFGRRYGAPHARWHAQLYCPAPAMDAAAQTRAVLDHMFSRCVPVARASTNDNGDDDNGVWTVYYCVLYVADMREFADVNAVYAGYFAGTYPPARCCIQIEAAPTTTMARGWHRAANARDDDKCVTAFWRRRRLRALADARNARVRLEVFAEPAQRRGRVMHVQSVSTWAPPCIGPYSQLTEHALPGDADGMHAASTRLYLSGMIGMYPPTAQLVAGSGVREQLAACLLNIDRVVAAHTEPTSPSPKAASARLPPLAFAVVYLQARSRDAIEQCGAAVRDMLPLPPDTGRVVVVGVPMLPRGALVEVQAAYGAAPTGSARIDSVATSARALPRGAVGTGTLFYDVERGCCADDAAQAVDAKSRRCAAVGGDDDIGDLKPGNDDAGDENDDDNGGSDSNNYYGDNDDDDDADDIGGIDDTVTAVPCRIPTAVHGSVAVVRIDACAIAAATAATADTTS